MNGHVIPGTPFAVDFWKIRECPTIKLFFLTHLHGDHTVGLSSSWQHPIYCSPVTGVMLLGLYGIQEDLVRPLDVGSSHVIPLDDVEEESMTVHVLDANHCPGSVMFVFQGYFGKILYTGDFRYHMDMVDTADSRLFCNVDRLYLDNTYCDARCVFPRRQEVISSIVNFIRSKPSFYNFVIGMRKLGKEDLLVSIAEQCNEYISVPADMYNRILYLGLPDVFLCDEENCRIRTVNFHNVSKKNVEKWNKTEPTIAILPTSLYIGQDVHPFCNVDHICVFPYSDHSSYTELMEFVDKVKPRKIVSIVPAESRGPFGLDLSSRADMSCFSHMLNTDQLGISELVRIPPSVGKWMKKRNTQILPSKARKRKHSKPTLRKKSSLVMKGVVFDGDCNSQSKEPSGLTQHVNDVQKQKNINPDSIYDFSEESIFDNGSKLQQTNTRNFPRRTSSRRKSTLAENSSSAVENVPKDCCTTVDTQSSDTVRDSCARSNIPNKSKNWSSLCRDVISHILKEKSCKNSQSLPNTADSNSDANNCQTGAGLRDINVTSSGLSTPHDQPTPVYTSCQSSVDRLSVCSGRKVVDVSTANEPQRYRMLADDLISENSADSDTAFQNLNLSRKKNVFSSPLIKDTTSDLSKKKLGNELVSDSKAVDKSNSDKAAYNRSRVKVLMDISDISVGFKSSQLSSQCEIDVNSRNNFPIITEFKQEFLNFLQSKKSASNTNNDTVVISSSDDEDRGAEQSKDSKKRRKRRKISHNHKVHTNVPDRGKISKTNADTSISLETDKELHNYTKHKLRRDTSHTETVKSPEDFVDNSVSPASEIISSNVKHIGSKQIVDKAPVSQGKATARPNDKVPLQMQQKRSKYKQLKLNMWDKFSRQNKVVKQVDSRPKSKFAHTVNEISSNNSSAEGSSHKSSEVLPEHCKKQSTIHKTRPKTRTSSQNLSIQKIRSSCKDVNELPPPEQKKMKAIVDFVCSEPFFSVKPLKFRNTNKDTLKRLECNRNFSSNLKHSSIEKELPTKRKWEKDAPFVWDVV